LIVLVLHAEVAVSIQPVKEAGCGCVATYPRGYIPQIITQPLPHTYVTGVPDNWDWRSMNGVSYVVPIATQNQPRTCGSCWAFAVTSSLSDRLKIGWKASRPDIVLSPQVLLDCGPQTTNPGTCNGGDSLAAYQFINTYGITDLTCLPYAAVDFSNWGENACTERMCRNCDFSTGNCYYINGTKYFVGDYGEVNGVDAMQAEIYQRGPISCYLYAHSPQFVNYTGGIIDDPTNYTTITHAVSIVGWGIENKTSYWIGRNSFGTYWGETGWFRILKGQNTLNLEGQPCQWGVPLVK
jgi:cathepsin X